MKGKDVDPMKRRVTQHSGRTARNGRGFTARHNDRNYDFENADNINENLTNANRYMNCYDGGYSHKDKAGKLSFAEAEAKYYNEHFLGQWQRTNDSYIRNRHSDRCKSFEEWSRQEKNLPEEVILQIGNTENKVDANTFLKAFSLYFKQLNSWNTENGNPFQILNAATHFDEAVPHSQLRRVWKYMDNNGVLCIGQEKALKEAGVSLPNPNSKESRFNNRKMTFDKMARELWINSCKQCGLEVEETPVLNAKHNRSKAETLEDKVKAKEKELDAREANITAYREEVKEEARTRLEEANQLLVDSKRIHKTLEDQYTDYSTNKPISNAKLNEKAIKQRENIAIALDNSLLPHINNKQKQNSISL